MKKLQLLMLMIFLAVTSCTTTKVARKTESAFRGDWTLNQITTDEGRNVELTKVFGNSNVKCFQGSFWHLVANNNTGYYSFQNTSCDSSENRIKWFVQEEDGFTYFWFKNVAQGQKDKEATSGYKLRIVSVDEYQAHLIHEIRFEGKKLNVHYYFNR